MIQTVYEIKNAHGGPGSNRDKVETIENERTTFLSI